VTPLGACGEIAVPGSYRVVADLQAPWDCLTIRASDVLLDCDGRRIAGNEFNGAGISVARYGPDLKRPEGIEIKNCKVSGFQYGIHVDGAKSIRVHHNDLSRNYDDTRGSYFGEWMGYVDGGGLRMRDTEEAVIEANTASWQAIGIDLRDSQRMVVRNNTTVRNSAFGIALWNTSDSEIVGNTVEDNYRWCVLKGGEYDGWPVQGCDAAGILLQDGSSRNVIRHNSILGSNGDGIYIKAPGMRCGDGNAILNNRIVGTMWNSIEAGFCDGITIAGNEVVRSKIGVWISFMEHVEIRENVFRDQEQYGIALKNTNYATVFGNTLSGGSEGILLNADMSAREISGFLHKPFEIYQSRGSVIQGNRLSDMKRSGIHLLNANGNVLMGNSFRATGRSYWFEGTAKNDQVRD
jgi:parallel beta-helix repeat protein